jgi:hypothetical protein
VQRPVSTVIFYEEKLINFSFQHTFLFPRTGVFSLRLSSTWRRLGSLSVSPSLSGLRLTPQLKLSVLSPCSIHQKIYIPHIVQQSCWDELSPMNKLMKAIPFYESKLFNEKVQT